MSLGMAIGLGWVGLVAGGCLLLGWAVGRARR